jgi:hypothetical protein
MIRDFRRSERWDPGAESQTNRSAAFPWRPPFGAAELNAVSAEMRLFDANAAERSLSSGAKAHDACGTW